MSHITAAELNHILELAVRAPSVHNTQPWVWTVTDQTLTLHRDPALRLPVMDQDGHDQLISCGATLRLAETALTAAGWNHRVELVPDPAQPDLLAVVTVSDRRTPSPHAVALVEAARHRTSDRRLLLADSISAAVRDDLRAGVSDDAAFVDFLDDDLSPLTVLTDAATTQEGASPEQRAETARWVHDGDDGVPLWAVPATAETARHSDVPQRAFVVDSTGTLGVPGGVDERPLFAVVFTHADQTADRLAAGGAMMMLMLEAEVRQLATCPVSQPVDHPGRRAQLSLMLGGTAHAQMVLRMGVPLDGRRLRTTPRRAPTEALVP